MPMILRDAFDEMTPDNTLQAVFYSVLSCKYIMKRFRDDLEVLKKSKENNVA